MRPTPPNGDVDALRRALAEVRDPRIRYHLRHALQYAVATETDRAERAEHA